MCGRAEVKHACTCLIRGRLACTLACTFVGDGVVLTGRHRFNGKAVIHGFVRAAVVGTSDGLRWACWLSIDIVWWGVQGWRAAVIQFRIAVLPTRVVANQRVRFLHERTVAADGV